MSPRNILVDLTGQSFGIWKVIEQAPRRDNKTRWLCECTTCGARCSMRSTSLRRFAYAKCFGAHNRRKGVPSPLRKTAGHAACTEMFNHYRAAATKRGFTFTLTRTEFDALTSQNCHYCAAPPGNRFTRRHYNGAFVYNGIDRRDSTVGYLPSNCLPSCSTCNVMKQDMPYDAFLAHIHKICSLHPGLVDPAATGRMALGLGGNFRRANLENTPMDDASPFDAALTPGATARRIERLEAEQRSINRKLEGYTSNYLNGQGEVVSRDVHAPAELGSNWWLQLTARAEQIHLQLEHDRMLIAQAIEAGQWTSWDKTTVHVGDLVSNSQRGSAGYRVARVNPKSVTLANRAEWPYKLKYIELRRVDCPHSPAMEPADLDECNRLAGLCVTCRTPILRGIDGPPDWYHAEWSPDPEPSEPPLGATFSARGQSHQPVPTAGSVATADLWDFDDAAAGKYPADWLVAE